jgi:hypothetical protein
LRSWVHSNRGVHHEQLYRFSSGRSVFSPAFSGGFVTQAVADYKELSEVERAFARLKDVIEMRPIFHQKAPRVQAHVFVASLAFLLDRAVEKKLKSAGLDISSREAWQLFKIVRVVDIGLGAQKTTRSVTQGSGRASKILKILGLKNLDPDSRKTGERGA